MKLIPLIFAGIIVISLASNSYSQHTENETTMKWYSMEEAQQKAKEDGKKIIIFGYADWCTYCRKMRKDVYPDSTVQNILTEHYYPVQINTESDERVVFNKKELKESELAAYLRLTSLPTHYFLDEEGEILGVQPGFLPADVFNPLLLFVGSGAYNNMGFEEFIETEN